MAAKRWLGIKVKWYFITIAIIILFVMAPWFCLFYLICGLVDIGRHGPYEKQLLRQYFIKNGATTWLLSPLNLLTDLLAWSMKPIYKLEELPELCQQEINEVINIAKQHNMIDIMNQRINQAARGMIFFKWYGKNIDNTSNIKDFQKKFKYIRTIGISAFNKHKSTSRHFGPLRLTLRVLYNLNPVQHDGVYIQVNKTKHYWHDEPLLIFDDTFLHQSFNEADQIRYCMFIDIIRPSRFSYRLINTLVNVVQFLMLKTNHVFYDKWELLK